MLGAVKLKNRGAAAPPPEMASSPPSDNVRAATPPPGGADLSGILNVKLKSGAPKRPSMVNPNAQYADPNAAPDSYSPTRSEPTRMIAAIAESAPASRPAGNPPPGGRSFAPPQSSHLPPPSSEPGKVRKWAPVMTPAEAKAMKLQPVADVSARTEQAIPAAASGRQAFQMKEMQKQAEIVGRTQEISNAPGFKEVCFVF